MPQAAVRCVQVGQNSEHNSQQNEHEKPGLLDPAFCFYLQADELHQPVSFSQTQITLTQRKRTKQLLG